MMFYFMQHNIRDSEATDAPPAIGNESFGTGGKAQQNDTAAAQPVNQADQGSISSMPQP